MIDICVVEDDEVQARRIGKALEEGLTDVHCRYLYSESEFRSNFWRLADRAPDLILLDIMLRWAQPSHDMPIISEEVLSAGPHRAGIRCLELLVSDEATRSVPVVLYTVVARNDLMGELQSLPKHVLVLEKGSDDRRLVRCVRSLAAAADKLEGRSNEMRERLRNAIEAKVGAFGVTVDLKKLMAKGS